VAGQVLKCIFFLLESELKHVGYCGALGNPVLAHLEHLRKHLRKFSVVSQVTSDLYGLTKYIFLSQSQGVYELIEMLQYGEESMAPTEKIGTLKYLQDTYG
jgi:hypothetical protein